MSATPEAISAIGLRRSFGDHLVLDGVDLTVPEGTVLALLGPNGAGKTTIVQILSTLLRAGAGEVRIAGHDVVREPDAVRAAIGVITFAVTWLSVALALTAKTVEAASNLPMPLMLLPFLGSGFVPTESMPGAMRWFAEYQPFTPMMETVRGLLLGTPIGNAGVLAVAWGVGIMAVGYFWARARYARPAR